MVSKFRKKKKTQENGFKPFEEIEMWAEEDNLIDFCFRLTLLKMVSITIVCKILF